VNTAPPRGLFTGVRPTVEEIARELPGDELVPNPDVVMDRAFTLPGHAADVWPWFLQLGKRRAGWYLTTALERAIPRSRRALRRIDPDWGGRNATFEVVRVEPPAALVYGSTRGSVKLSWAIVLGDGGSSEEPTTRVQLRLRLSPVRRLWLARSAGALVDLLTVAGLASGLRERLEHRGRHR